MIRYLLASLCCLLVLGAASASADTVIADRSEIAFTMKQMGVKFDGRFKRFKTDIVFRPGALAESKADIDVDLASLDLASSETETEARTPQWFNTAKFPVAHFGSTSIRDLGNNRYAVAGRLSLKGVARDYVIPVTVRTDASGVRTAEGTFAIKRLEHKVGEGEWADTDTVADDVVVRLRIVLAAGGTAATK